MSKYVNHDHGMIIGSNNVFFVIDEFHPKELPKVRDNYSAVVSFRTYDFDQVNSVNVIVETPANQLVWKRETVHDGRYPPHVEITKQVHNPSDLTLGMLDNFGVRGKDYDYYTDSEKCNRCLFFRRRKDALSFVNHVKNLLRGINIPKD